MRTAALLVAAGSGQRFGAAVPKQFLDLLAAPVIRHAAAALAGAVDLLQPVGEAEPIGRALAGIPHLAPVAGGASRQESVRRGLEALALHAPDLVLVHDAARPVIPPGTIEAVLAALAEHEGVIPAVPISDTLKRVAGGRIVATVPREGLFRAQTPQGFRFSRLLALHRAAAAAAAPAGAGAGAGGGAAGATDDAALLEAAGIAVAIVPGAEENVKITYPEDLRRAERALGGMLVPHVGTGFDVHAIAAGRRLVLCGVEIAHEHGLAGHSDADVGIHALCDAIYGALAEGDIGRHFPPAEAVWKDADSARFLVHAAARIAARGGRLAHADVTLICERPKIAPHAEAMRARLAALLGAGIGIVSVKATTTERLGFTGRGEGIAAQAAATVLLPP